MERTMTKEGQMKHDDRDDAPELTEAVLARGKRGADVLPAAVLAGLKRTPGRPKSDNPKLAVKLRLNRAVVDHFKAQGAGWQTRINETLERAIADG